MYCTLYPIVSHSLTSHTLHRERKGLITLQLASCCRGRHNYIEHSGYAPINVMPMGGSTGPNGGGGGGGGGGVVDRHIR